MNTKSLPINLLSGLILLSGVFLTACSSIGGVPVALAQPETVAEIPGTGFDLEYHSGVDQITFYRSNTAAEASLIEEDNLRTWEIGADDIAAARGAAATLSQTYTAVGADLVEEDVLRSWEIGADDIAAAREAAATLSQANALGEVDFDANGMVSGELDASDISAARQAAQTLAAAERVHHEISIADFSAARQTAQYLAAAAHVSGELDAGDISAARQAAQTLSYIFVAGEVGLKNPAFQRTAAELELARRFRASEEHLALLSSE